jgi:hypothetical protein
VDVRSTSIENIHGTNSSVRRSTIERFGMWDECTQIEDESSFCYRVNAGKRPDEYMVFDPEAAILRRLDIDGGLDKRGMTARTYGRRVFLFFHNVVAHYHTARVVLLYPAYVWLLFWVTADWIWNESRRHRTAPRRIAATAGLLAALPALWAMWLAELGIDRVASGPPRRADRLQPRTGAAAGGAHAPAELAATVGVDTAP